MPTAEPTALRVNTESFLSPFQEALNATPRLIFSGKFGSGKTTFLHHVFANRAEQFEVVHLYPVNYAVLENRDVLNFLRRDILISLLGRMNDVEAKTSINEAILAYGTAFNITVTEFYDSILEILPQLGKTVDKTLGMFDRFFKVAKENKQLLADDDRPKLQNEISKMGKEYYINYVAEGVIKGALQSLKKNNEKQTILIIDDLDRLNPHHIFRLFDLFYTQLDENDPYQTNEQPATRLGFDKVIFVCDIDNIKAIFHHTFGERADFKGYISKFSASTPFKFDPVIYYKNFLDTKFTSWLSSTRRYKEYLNDWDKVIHLTSLYLATKKNTVRDLVTIDFEFLHDNIWHKYHFANNKLLSIIESYGIIIRFLIIVSHFEKVSELSLSFILGIKNKGLLFSIVESIASVVRSLGIDYLSLLNPGKALSDVTDLKFEQEEVILSHRDNRTTKVDLKTAININHLLSIFNSDSNCIELRNVIYAQVNHQVCD